MKAYGARLWVVPDGWLPAKEPKGDLESHEALMVTNTGDREATVRLTFLFEDRDPVRGIEVKVPAERVKCFRLDHPEEIGGLRLPELTQYALVVESSEKVSVQFGRLDASQPNLAYYGCIPVQDEAE
ncbi:MAG: sensory rhodopsin transducer [Patescibacteria group bacterium]